MSGEDRAKALARITNGALTDIGRYPAAETWQKPSGAWGVRISARDATQVERRRAAALAALSEPTPPMMRCSLHGISSRSGEKCDLVHPRDVLRGCDEPCSRP